MANKVVLKRNPNNENLLAFGGGGGGGGGISDPCGLTGGGTGGETTFGAILSLTVLDETLRIPAAPFTLRLVILIIVSFPFINSF